MNDQLRLDVPTSTYRLQMRPEFDFEDAGDVVSYLADLGELGRPLLDWNRSITVHAAGEPLAKPAADPDEHFVPPAPPPVPRPTLATVLAVLVTLLGVAIIAFGYSLGLPSDLPLPLGVVLVLFGAGLLVLRLRPEPRDDSDDDGAVV